MLNSTQKITPEPPTERQCSLSAVGVVPRYQSSVVFATDQAGLLRRKTCTGQAGWYHESNR